MLTFFQYLEELADTDRTVILLLADAQRLVNRFGQSVRSMGHTTEDGGLEIPVSVIREAVTRLDGKNLSEAVTYLKSDQIFDSASVNCLIEQIGTAYLRYLRNLMTRFQDSADPDEILRLRDQLVREVFGS